MEKITELRSVIFIRELTGRDKKRGEGIWKFEGEYICFEIGG